MAIRAAVLTSFLTLASVMFPVAVKADTVNARCDLYPLGSDRASAVLPCTFSQRQGNVGIALEDGHRYDFRPVGDQPGNFVDQNGQGAYRQAGLGDRGQIYQTAYERIYVYWDTSGIPGRAVAAGPSGQGSFVTLSASDPNTRINLRSSATIDSVPEGYGIPGDRVQLLQCVPDHDRYESTLNWCEVRFPQSRAVGWVRSDFIIFEDAGE